MQKRKSNLRTLKDGDKVACITDPKDLTKGRCDIGSVQRVNKKWLTVEFAGDKTGQFYYSGSARGGRGMLCPITAAI